MDQVMRGPQEGASSWRRRATTSFSLANFSSSQQREIIFPLELALAATAAPPNYAHDGSCDSSSKRPTRSFNCLKFKKSGANLAKLLKEAKMSESFSFLQSELEMVPNEKKKFVKMRSEVKLDSIDNKRNSTNSAERRFVSPPIDRKFSCCQKYYSKLAELPRKRKEIGAPFKALSCLFWILTIVIGRQLYTQLRCNLATDKFNLNFNENKNEPTRPTCQGCLSDVLLWSRTGCPTEGLFRLAFGAALDGSTTSGESLGWSSVSGVTTAEAQQQQSNSNQSSHWPLLANLGRPQTDTTTDATTATATATATTTTSTSSTTINNGTTMPANSTTTNHQYQVQQQLNVLCNSRCNCVLLVPLFSSSLALTNSRPELESGAGKLAAGRREEASSPGASSASGVIGTTEATLQATTNNAPTTTGNDNIGESSEQALIAFNEDYSLDYEQTQASSTTTTTTTTTTNGNGSDDSTSAEPVAGLNPAAAGNDRAATRRVTSAEGPLSSLANVASSAVAGSEQQKGGQGSNNNSGHVSASPTPNQANNSNDSISLLEPTLPTGNFTTTANENENLDLDSSPNATTSTANPSDVAGSGSSRHQQPLQAKQSDQLQPKKQPGMTLFPLPTPHLRLNQHHQLHHHHPLGAQRESSGPQLYAQSLYSSQAPKLSYHAHTPYLKSASSSNNNAQQQHQNTLAGSIQSDVATQVGAQNVPATGPHHSKPATPGGVQGNPFQYHHMRSNYLAHHLRQQQDKLPISNNNYIASNANYVFPQQFVLMPLKMMNMSQRLTFTSQHNNNNNNNVSSSNNNSANLNQVNDFYQDIDHNWKDYPELINQIQLMLDEIEEKQIQSLSLSHNELQFELWSELYALLAVQMRQHLFHLNLSHNSLMKLGITFTGYVEHHIAAHNGWPIQQTNNQQANQTTSSSVNNLLGSNGVAKSNPFLNKQARMRHSLFSGGKLYNLIKEKKRNETSGSLNSMHPLNTSTLLQQPLLIKALDLSHNKIKWLIKDQFRALKHVQTIRLDYNRIRYIHQHAFSGLESLRFLNLNFNRLQVIYIEQFQTNYNLLALMLRSNYLAYLRGGSFASLANLKRLDLSRNKLTILSNNAFIGLESLELLNCSSNQFVHAPSASLHPLTSLRKLDLSDNLIAQLAPGTFFHLPIEELWLNQNEQLVAIDRGAFWDLPYLRKLHLRSNPMLMSLNSQAFVGTQNLQTIDVEGCQSLYDSARQMLDNITMTATSRLLRYSEQQQAASIENVNSTTATNSSTPESKLNISPLKMNMSLSVTNQSIQLDSKQQAQTIFPRHSSHHIKQIIEAQSNKLRYIYYLGVLTFLVVALKLVFKYTSTSHYLEARRRRRRVYEATNSNNKSTGDSFYPDDANSMSSSNVDAFPMCVQPESHILGGIGNALGVINNQVVVDDGSGGELCRYQLGADLDGDQNDASEQRLRIEESSYDILSQQQQEEVAGEQVTVSNVSDNTSSPVSHFTSSSEQAIDNIGEAASVQDLQNSCEQVAAGNEQEQEPAPVEDQSGDQNEPIEIGPSVISNAGVILSPTCCPDCPQQQPMVEAGEAGAEQIVTGVAQQLANDPTSVGLNNHTSFDLLHSQLVAAGFDYGHANCAHFYQSLGPALQLADITANFVDNMDYY